MDKKCLLIYHKEDNDGVFSGALLYDYLISTMKYNSENIVCMGSEYNELANFAKENDVEDLHKEYDKIIMTDISFNDPKYMKKLWEEFKYDFIWCDHHAPIIKASFENKFDDVPGVRDTQRSAILCVWKYLYDTFDEAYNNIERNKPIYEDGNFPELFRVLSGWDSWSYEREGYSFDYVRNVNKGVTFKYKLDFNKVYELVKLIRLCYVHDEHDFHTMNGRIGFYMLIDEMREIGETLNAYDDQTMEQIIRYNGDCSWKIITDNMPDGNTTWRPACAIFHQGATNSTMFKSLNGNGMNIMNGIVFKHAKNGNWTVSVYNIRDNEPTPECGGFHCGDFCKKHYNGGGHAGAAGFTITEEQFIKILKNKQLG